MSKKKWIIIGAFVIVAVILVVFNSKKTATDETGNNTPDPNKEKGKGNTTDHGNKLPEGEEEKIDQNVCYMTSNEIKKLADLWYDETNHAFVDDKRVDNIFNSLKKSNMRTKAEFWAVLETYSQLYTRWFTCVIDGKADRMIANQILASKGIDVTFTDNKIK